MVAGSDPGMRRVSVHADGITVDLALPATVPVAALIPSILDILPADIGPSSVDPTPGRYQLSCPGGAVLDPSKTLAHNAIRDGAMLILTRSSAALSAPCFDDPAEAVSTTLDAVARPWTRRTARITGAAAALWFAGLGGVLLIRIALAGKGIHHGEATAAAAAVTGCVALVAAVIAHRVYRDEIGGLTLGLLATGFVTAAGLLAVPDGVGAPNVLLAAMSAAVMSVVTMQLTGCSTVALTAVSCLAIVIASTALAVVITAAPLHVIGSMSAVASLVLLEVSARVSIAWTGLSPQLPTARDPTVRDIATASKLLRLRAIRADNRLTSLVIAFASAAAIGAICTVIGINATAGPRLGGVGFATLIGAVLLLRARSHLDLTRTLGLIVTGTVTLSATFVVAATSAAQHTAWIAAGTATLTAAAVCLGFVTRTLTFSPIARRSVDLLEFFSLAVIVPLACWICGFYSVVRGLHVI